MSSPPTTEPVGEQHPRISSVPPCVSSAGQEAVGLAHLAGLHLDPWQALVLEGSLGLREDGRWAAPDVGVMVSRQNGKGAILTARELAGLFIFGEELILHSAHEFATSMEAYRRLRTLIENTPKLSRRVKRFIGTHGAEGVELVNGQRIQFRTRTKAGGLGFSAPCVILDEAMILPTETMSALIPVVSAQDNRQIWFTGSAVDQEIHPYGIPFARVRERGLARDDTLAYYEWSINDEQFKLHPEMADDPQAWARANPGLGIRISEENIRNEQRTITSRRSFATQRLGVGDWPSTDDTVVPLIDPAAWRGCEDLGSEPLDPVCFAFDVSPDRSRASIAVCGYRKDGLPHVEVIEHFRGTFGLVSRLAELVKAHKTHSVVCDPAGPAGSLGADIASVVGLRANGESRFEPITAKEYGQACGLFYDAVSDKQLRHLGPDAAHGAVLEEAIDGAITRPLGDSWAWSRKNSSTDISPLVAVTLALFANDRRPKARPRAINLNTI